MQEDVYIKPLYLNPQSTSFSCGIATYMTLIKDMWLDPSKRIEEEIERMLYIKNTNGSLLMLAISFVELAEYDGELDKIVGIYYMEGSHAIYTLSEKVLKLIATYEKIEYSYIQKIKHLYEEKIKQYEQYIRVLMKDQFERMLFEYLKTPSKYGVAILTYQRLEGIEIEVPHWIVPLSILTSNKENKEFIVLAYDPFKNAILYLPQKIFLKLIYRIAELDLSPQYVVISRNR